MQLKQRVPTCLKQGTTAEGPSAVVPCLVLSASTASCAMMSTGCSSWHMGQGVSTEALTRMILVNALPVIVPQVVQHRSIAGTKELIKRHWRCAVRLDKPCQIELEIRPHDVDEFVKSYIVCVKSKRGERVPRVMGNMLHATRPNQLVHFDFTFMEKSITPSLYHST